ncbi:hypothetical protein Ddc_19977 [Ditylenchus destructor]|nr:hypothetical protein Ddc_19977 [Ditylenchus destructor]
MNRCLLISTLLGAIVSLVVAPPKTHTGATVDAKHADHNHQELEKDESIPSYIASNGNLLDEKEKPRALNDTELAKNDSLNDVLSKGQKRTG